jgi:diguanylate cyclase (GGDEF)-like protein
MSRPSAALRLRRAADRLRRPAELVERTRWLFCVCALAALALTTLAALPALTVATLPLLLTSCAALGFSWVHRYRARHAPQVLDVTDVLACLLFALACPQPGVALGLTFPALWYRAVYGRTRQVTAYGAALTVAMSVSVLAWRLLPGHGAPAASAVFGALPVMLLTVVVARHLALSLLQRERDQAREAALASLSSALLGVTDRRQIMREAWTTAEAVCRVTSGLRIAVVHEDGDVLRVVGIAGDFLRPPTTLPRTLLPATRPTEEPAPVDPPDALVLGSGIRGEWLVLPMPDSPGAYMLLGGTPSVQPEAVLAAQSMLNQVALALRTCDALEGLQAQALTDELTGLANRSAFSTAMAEALENPDTETWVLFLDLDDFKVVNDSLGHLAGDRLLGHLGSQLTGTLRAGDLCARLGGDEFAVLLRGATESDARAIGRRVIELISTPVQLAEGLARIGASVGASRVRPGTSETLVVHQADVAMYAAKAAGKNQMQFFHAGLLELDDRAAAEAELRAAVEGGELVLAYQPVVSAADGRCTAVEALVRWDHPDRGLLGPDLFLGLAEETGAIIALGERVLRAACVDAATWDDPSAPVTVHVNASPTELVHPHFVDLVRRSLADAGLAPERLVIEITESTVLDSPAVSATLDELVRQGVGIALDDFGTGYSALTTLRSLPIDIVKIDKSFVAGALTQAADQAVVEAIVQMADRLGLQTVAEGVESLEQHDFLVAAGISALQGFRYLPPAPVAEFRAWLAENRRAGELTPA